jgi:hypothetical protein
VVPGGALREECVSARTRKCAGENRGKESTISAINLTVCLDLLCGEACVPVDVEVGENVSRVERPSLVHRSRIQTDVPRRYATDQPFSLRRCRCIALDLRLLFKCLFVELMDLSRLVTEQLGILCVSLK